MLKLNEAILLLVYAKLSGTVKNGSDVDMALRAKDIAEMIGVSQATLSLVINNKPGISAKTKEKVIQALKDRGLDYLLIQEKADGSKNDDGGKQLRNIGFVIYTIQGELLGYNSFFPFIMQGVEARARRHGYNVLFIKVRKEHAKEDLQHILDANCIGCVVFATEMHSEDSRAFQELSIPVILLDNYFSDQRLNAVKLNNVQGTYLAVKYLMDCGHREIGYLRSGLEIDSFDERYQAALNAMRQFGITEPEAYVYEIGYRPEKAKEAMTALLKKKVKMPTAFLADNDVVAASAMTACINAGLHVPEDISFVGFDDRPECILCNPPLTTIKISRQYFGAEAVELLVRVLNGEPGLFVKMEIGTELVERESVAKRIGRTGQRMK